MPSLSSLRPVLTPRALLRLVVGWFAVLSLSLAAPLLAPPVPAPLLTAVLAAIVGVILLCSFGVVHEAEALAHRLGDPYGTLVLTLSIVTIEVVLIAAVMLDPGDHATIARDSVMAVSMIIMNLVLGACLLVGALRHRRFQANRAGALTYTLMLAVMGSVAFALPGAIGVKGGFTTVQAAAVAAMTVALYALFLWRQTGSRARDFQEVTLPGGVAAMRLDVGPVEPSQVSSDLADAGPHAGRAADHGPDRPISRIIADHRAELLARSALLVATVLPIVLLSHDLAALLDDGLGRVGAPTALSGVLIALIVFTPESITALRAARGGEAQRVVNLCHGALVSTLGLTIPTVLAISLLTGQRVVLAESPANLALLGATLAATTITAASRQITTAHGAVHLLLFGAYAVVLFG